MKWISVEDRLPFPKTSVLVCNSQNGFVCIMYKDEGDPGWYDHDREQMRVTHWMHLPNPPTSAKP